MVIWFTNINEKIAYKFIQLNNIPTTLRLFLYILMNVTALFSPFEISFGISQLLLAPVKGLPDQYVYTSALESQKLFIRRYLHNILH